jgi:hypothetical protein
MADHDCPTSQHEGDDMPDPTPVKKIEPPPEPENSLKNIAAPGVSPRS